MTVESTQPNLGELEFEFATFRGRIACLSSEAFDQFTSLVMYDSDLDDVIDLPAIEIEELPLDFGSLTDLESFMMA